MQSLAPALTAPFPERILHGDLFLENCMFDGDDFVAMIDFEVNHVLTGDAAVLTMLKLYGSSYDIILEC